MLAGEHLRIKDYQTLVGVSGDILNIWYFEVVSVTGTFILTDEAGILNSWFVNDFLDKIVDIQTPTLGHSHAMFESMENWATEFVDVVFAIPATGTVASEYTSSVAAWSFQLIRTERTTRNGSKRIAGVPESYANENRAVAGGVAAVAAAATSMADTWVIDNGSGDTMTIKPVIAKTPTPPATIPTVFNDVADVLFRGLGSQNSRKQLYS